MVFGRRFEPILRKLSKEPGLESTPTKKCGVARIPARNLEQVGKRRCRRAQHASATTTMKTYVRVDKTLHVAAMEQQNLSISAVVPFRTRTAA
jgi:hypothetical protein